MDLTDGQWEVLEPLIPDPPRREDGRGRDPGETLAMSSTAYYSGYFAPALPGRTFPNATRPTRDLSPALSEVDRRRGAFEHPQNSSRRPPRRARGDRPLGMLHRRDVRRGQKRGEHLGKTKRGKGTKLMAFAEGSCVPLAVHTEGASPHEVTLVEATLAGSFLKEKPKRLIGDKA